MDISVAEQTRSDAAAEASRQVLIFSPSVKVQGGGIARLVNYLTDVWQQQARETGGAVFWKVIWSRGPGTGLWPHLHFFAALAATLNQIARRRVSLLHLNISIRASTVRKGILLLVGKMAGLPVLLHLHGGRYPDFYAGLPSPLRSLVRRLFQNADRVIVLGRRMRRFVVEELGVDERRVVTIPNAVQGPDAAPVRDGRGRPCRILFLGHVCPDKGMDELMTALAALSERGLDVSVTIGGNGMVEQYREKAGRLGLAGRVRFMGWIEPDEVCRLLADSDVLVLPSHAEALPMSIIEGMAYGNAIVATPVGDIPDVVQDGQNGLLVPVGDPQALAGALARVAEDIGLRERLGQAARRSFEQHYDIRRCAKRIGAIYQSLGAFHSPENE